MTMANEAEINTILEIVGDFKADELRVASKAKGSAELNLVEDLNLDSLELINLLFKIEEKYGIQISETELKSGELMVIGNLAAAIAKRRA